MPVTGASYSPFFFSFVLSIHSFIFGDLGFFVFQLFLQLLVSGWAIFVADTGPAMSSKALGGLPRAQVTRQGSRAGG
jgi:hypothetical protein